MSRQWIIAIGTAVLAILALFQDFIRSWLKTPSLAVATGSCSPFCKKLLFIRPDDPEKRADGYALRIRVKNTKPFLRIKSRAEKVEVFALRLLKKQTDGSFQPIQEFEPRNLIWSHSFQPLTDISPEMERYCFIGRIVKPESRHNFPDFDVESYNMNLPNLPRNSNYFAKGILEHGCCIQKQKKHNCSYRKRELFCISFLFRE